MARGLAVFVELVCVSRGDSLAGVQEVHELWQEGENERAKKETVGGGGGGKNGEWG